MPHRRQPLAELPLQEWHSLLISDDATRMFLSDEHRLVYMHALRLACSGIADGAACVVKVCEPARVWDRQAEYGQRLESAAEPAAMRDCCMRCHVFIWRVFCFVVLFIMSWHAVFAVARVAPPVFC